MNYLIMAMQDHWLLRAIAGFLLAACIVCCGKGQAQTRDTHPDSLRDFARPDAIPFPPENPFTPAKAALGRLLFFDPVLSKSGAIACATCHSPSLSWGDGLPLAVGEARKPLPFRSPTLLGVAWAEALGWDGKFPTLEQVAFIAITGVANMGHSAADVLRDVTAIAGYRDAFATAMPGLGISRRTIEDALATYQRTLVPTEAPFDRWVRGDTNAVSENAKRGFDMFTGRAGCVQCHNGWRFTDDSFHDIGIATGAQLGRGRMFPGSVALRYAFKTPTLRDAARRGPYMHDGSVKTLSDVISLYDRGGIDRVERDPLIRPLGLSAEERDNLLAFLETLTSDPVEMPVPILPR